MREIRRPSSLQTTKRPSAKGSCRRTAPEICPLLAEARVSASVVKYLSYLMLARMYAMDLLLYALGVSYIENTYKEDRKAVYLGRPKGESIFSGHSPARLREGHFSCTVESARGRF